MVVESGTRSLWLLALLLWLWTPLAHANLQVESQRRSMTAGETLGVVVSSDSGLDLNQLDLSPLEADFQILSRSSSTSISLVNGVRSQQNTLNLELAPKRSGELQIPALNLDGHSSQALTITVNAAPTVNPGLDPSRDFILEVDVDTTSPYVQQQVRLTVKLMFAVSLSDGNLSDPQSNAALIERLGEDASYRTQIQGRTYQVVERQYALTPQSSGPLRIDPVTLNGRRASGRGFFNRGQPVSVASRVIDLQVRPRPTSYGDDPWLPARSLALNDQLSADSARVGEPLTRTLTLAAVGLPQSLLPALGMQPSEQYQVYPDQPARSGSSRDGWLISQLEQKIAIVPSQPGTITLPALQVVWWDVGTDQLRTASVAERVIEVLPALVGGVATNTIATPGEDPALRPLSGPISVQTVSRPGYWPWISALFASLWLITAALYWRSQRSAGVAKRQPTQSPQLAPALKALKQACRDNQPADAEQAVVDLYLARGGPRCGSAMILAQQLPPGAARQALIELDQVRFARDGKGWNGASLLSAADEIAPPAPTVATDSNGLPPLYSGRAS